MLAVSHCMVPTSVAGEFTTHAQAALAASAARSTPARCFTRPRHSRTGVSEG